MKITTKRFEIDEKTLNPYRSYSESIIQKIENVNTEVLRFAIVEKKDNKIVVEASLIEAQGKLNQTFKYPHSNTNKFVVVNIVPTGVRAEIGGYIADATPVTNVMAEVADIVVTHPNVVNGSFVNYARDNVLYVEGYHLDNFLRDYIALTSARQNKIGVIIDSGAILVDSHSIDMVINTIESMRVIAGIDIIGYKITDEPIGGHATKMPSGAFCGEIENPQTLINAAKVLIENGATAIAIASYINISDKHDLSEYFKGNLANPFGGTEALISHLISRIFNIPCAHAPILPKSEKDFYEKVAIVDPRASSEVVSPGYLGCILKGLNHAPQISNIGITRENINAIVIPYGCCGGIPALTSDEIPLICVKENKTVLEVTPEKMNLKNAIVVENYLEVIGIIAAMKSGITIESLRRPFNKVKEIK